MDYRQIYNKIINRAKKEFSLGLRIKKKKGDPDYVYYEGHHIIPKCVGGEGSSKNWYHDNIVPLTPKEHFLAHKLLLELYPNHTGVIQSFCYLCRLNKKTSSRVYQKLRSVLSQKIIERQTGKKRPDHSKKLSGKNHFFFGVKRPEIGYAISVKMSGNKNATKKVADLKSGKQFSSINEAADYYEVDPRTITRWVKRHHKISFL